MTPSAQVVEALARANEVRMARADVRHRIAAGEMLVCDLLLAPPSVIKTMTVYDLLRAQHRWGRRRTMVLLAVVGLRELKQVGMLTERQRLVLADELRFRTAAVEQDAA